MAGNYSWADIFGETSSANSQDYGVATWAEGLESWTAEVSTYDYNSGLDLSDFFGDLEMEDSATKSGIWDWVKNSESLMGAIGGAAKAGLSYYQNEENNDLSKELSAISEDQFNRSLALQESMFNQEMELKRDIFNDQVNTRKRHNESIADGPTKAPTTITRKS